MWADGVVHVVHVAAVGAGDLLDAARLRLLRVAQQIEFELFAALAALDVHVQRTGHDLTQIAEEHAESPLLQLHIAEALHLAAAGGTGFLAHKTLLSVKTPSALASRGRIAAVPPLVRRFLAETALWSADTPLRDNGRTRHTPTAQYPAFQRAAPGCIRLTPSAFLHRPKALWRRDLSGYFFPSSL